MPRKPYINKFPEGLDKDSDDKIRKNTTYKDAHNVQLTGDGKFGGLQNLKGTTFIGNIVSSGNFDNINYLGAFEARTFVYNSTFDNANIEECVYIFYVTDLSSLYSLHIDVYEPSTSMHYNIYTEVTDSTKMNSVIDAFIFGEDGVDTLYYTISGKETGKIRCILDTNSPTITKRNTELLKRYPSNGIEVSDILYNPKSDSAVSDTHIISLSTVSEINLSSYKMWRGDALFDSDTQSGDDFDVEISWSLNLDAGTSNNVSGHIFIHDNVAGGVSFNEAQTITTGYYSNSGTRIISRSGVYNADPIRIEVSIDMSDSSAPAFASASANINYVNEISGGDTYLRGTPVNKNVMIIYNL